MEGKKLLLVFLALLLVFSLIIYYFMPFGGIEFLAEPKTYSTDSSFSLDGDLTEMQFHPNLRFPESNISYKIHDCNIRKKEEMRFAFDIIENITILNFYEVEEDEQIIVTCDEKERYEGGIFIAGEGGPIEIIQAGEYNVILKGKILLIRSSDCAKPNIAVHELIHVLGFIHSDNPQNIMYPYTNCGQTIGKEIPELINNVYSQESYPDLTFEDASANMKYRGLNIQFLIRNIGLKDAVNSSVLIKMGNSLIKEIEIGALEIGMGKTMTISNLFVKDFKIEDIELHIEYPEKELSKENNKIILEIV